MSKFDNLLSPSKFEGCRGDRYVPLLILSATTCAIKVETLSTLYGSKDIWLQSCWGFLCCESDFQSWWWRGFGFVQYVFLETSSERQNKSSSRVHVHHGRHCSVENERQRTAPGVKSLFVCSLLLVNYHRGRLKTKRDQLLQSSKDSFPRDSSSITNEAHSEV